MGRPPHCRAAFRVRALCAAAALLLLGIGKNDGWAQRVQFPSTIPGTAPYPSGAVAPYSSTPVPYAPPAAMPGFDPYGNTALGAPPLDIPYTTPQAASPFSMPAPALTPAPAMSPFGATPAPTLGAPGTSMAPLGVPPGTAYGAGATQPLTPYASQGGGLFPSWNSPGAPQPGTYDHTNPDGSVARLQRLLQQISFEHTWLSTTSGDDSLGLNRSEIAATFGVPIFANPDTPLLITPGFAFNWWDGPSGPTADLPPRTYDAYLDAAWHPRFSPMLAADLGVRTGVWTDFEVVNSDSIRILGRGLGVITVSPQFDFLLGVWYLDRNKIALLPAGGVHWKPSPDWDAYLVFPNPKLRRRFINAGAAQWWWYVGGEYGGGRWTLERADGRDDDVDYNDIRVFGGIEWVTPTQLRGHIEAGYVWDRELIYDGTRDPAFFNLDDTVMVRGGVDF